MHLHDLLDPVALEAAIAAKHVKRGFHRSEPLAILNYTQSCSWERAWTETTRLCRGLIYRTDTMEIVARPFAKFFNYGEPECPIVDWGQLVQATDKIDGSLGILYPLPLAGGHAIATRGSFTSSQAIHATELYQRFHFQPWPGYTELFEIVYPENRIVVNYGKLDDLIGLASIEIATGRTVRSAWPGHKAGTIPVMTGTEALSEPPRKNAEGIVVHFPRTGHRIKLKQADYMALHRIITGTNARRLWTFLAVNACKQRIDAPNLWASKLRIDPAEAVEVLEAGDDWQEKMLAGVPDEFFGWCRRVIAGIELDVHAIRDEVGIVVGGLPEGATRKEIAARLGFSPHSGAVFNVLDGKQIDTYCWLQARPDSTEPYRPFSEDVA